MISTTNIYCESVMVQACVEHVAWLVWKDRHDHRTTRPFTGCRLTLQVHSLSFFTYSVPWVLSFADTILRVPLPLAPAGFPEGDESEVCGIYPPSCVSLGPQVGIISPLPRPSPTPTTLSSSSGNWSPSSSLQKQELLFYPQDALASFHECS